MTEDSLREMDETVKENISDSELESIRINDDDQDLIIIIINFQNEKKKFREGRDRLEILRRDFSNLKNEINEHKRFIDESKIQLLVLKESIVDDLEIERSEKEVEDTSGFEKEKNDISDTLKVVLVDLEVLGNDCEKKDAELKSINKLIQKGDVELENVDHQILEEENVINQIKITINEKQSIEVLIKNFIEKLELIENKKEGQNQEIKNQLNEILSEIDREEEKIKSLESYLNYLKENQNYLLAKISEDISQVNKKIKNFESSPTAFGVLSNVIKNFVKVSFGLTVGVPVGVLVGLPLGALAGAAIGVAKAAAIEPCNEENDLLVKVFGKRLSLVIFSCIAYSLLGGFVGGLAVGFSPLINVDSLSDLKSKREELNLAKSKALNSNQIFELEKQIVEENSKIKYKNDYIMALKLGSDGIIEQINVFKIISLTVENDLKNENMKLNEAEVKVQNLNLKRENLKLFKSRLMTEITKFEESSKDLKLKLEEKLNLAIELRKKLDFNSEKFKRNEARKNELSEKKSISIRSKTLKNECDGKMEENKRLISEKMSLLNTIRNEYESIMNEIKENRSKIKDFENKLLEKIDEKEGLTLIFKTI